MPSLSDLLGAAQQATQAIRDLQVQLANSFPPITTLSTTAPTVGTLSYSSSLVATFGLVQTSSGGTYRVALLASS